MMDWMDPKQNTPVEEGKRQKQQKHFAVNAQAPLNPPKKLQQFFTQNHWLVEKMQKRKPEDAPVKRPLHKAYAKQINLTPLYATYFENISEICIDIITKSDLNKQDRINMRGEIKKLAWSYTEDANEGLDIPIDYYFDKLSEVLQGS